MIALALGYIVVLAQLAYHVVLGPRTEQLDNEYWEVCVRPGGANE